MAYPPCPECKEKGCICLDEETIKDKNEDYKNQIKEHSFGKLSDFQQGKIAGKVEILNWIKKQGD